MIFENKREFLLNCLAEEADEIGQCVAKIFKHGDSNHHPDRESTNEEDLDKEINDILAIICSLGYDIQVYDERLSYKERRGKVVWLNNLMKEKGIRFSGDQQ